MNFQFETLYKAIIGIQFLSATAFFIKWAKTKNSINSSIIYWVVCLLSLLIAVLMAAIVYLVLIFNPSFF